MERAVLVAGGGNGVITITIYVVLVPLLVFFFLKDKDLIRSGCTASAARSTNAASLARWTGRWAIYVRGKFLEVLVVWAATFIAFAPDGLAVRHVARPDGGAVGNRALYWCGGGDGAGGAGGVFQWAGVPIHVVAGAYLIIQGLDGNVLVPLLFSEVVDLHPIAIIVAVLGVRRSLGFWGFFAIPLATVVQSILKAWPRPTPASGE